MRKNVDHSSGQQESQVAIRNIYKHSEVIQYIKLIKFTSTKIQKGKMQSKAGAAGVQPGDNGKLIRSQVDTSCWSARAPARRHHHHHYHVDDDDYHHVIIVIMTLLFLFTYG